MRYGSGASEHGQAVIGMNLHVARADLHDRRAVRFDVSGSAEDRQRLGPLRVFPRQDGLAQEFRAVCLEQMRMVRFDVRHEPRGLVLDAKKCRQRARIPAARPSIQSGRSRPTSLHVDRKNLHEPLTRESA